MQCTFYTHRPLTMLRHIFGVLALSVSGASAASRVMWN
jgi:hypothetical protein